MLLASQQPTTSWQICEHQRAETGTISLAIGAKHCTCSQEILLSEQKACQRASLVLGCSCASFS